MVMKWSSGHSHLHLPSLQDDINMLGDFLKDLVLAWSLHTVQVTGDNMLALSLAGQCRLV